MTYPKITLKPKSWAEDSTIELDYEDAKEIWEQLKTVFEPVRLSQPFIWFPSPEESATKTNEMCKNTEIKFGGRVYCTCPKCSRVTC